MICANRDRKARIGAKFMLAIWALMVSVGFVALGDVAMSELPTLVLAIGLLSIPVGIALAAGVLARGPALTVLSGGFAATTAVLAIWLLWEAFTSTSSTAPIAFVFYPVVEVAVLCPVLLAGALIDLLLRRSAP
ncbi:hypothetical protein [Sphingomonas sp. M1-B02]|uniref:hypothetical protein n=1 Tax=Sphingomonas sp. M1-B02 TaxID=3114300 RepID=UPI00223FF853|nr:hypothetical protein [Sphingomonas sp. S6-11]UZK65767.1 hypothetical protein OKW87_14825 [Sphingomonas sp. S6-11]